MQEIVQIALQVSAREHKASKTKLSKRTNPLPWGSVKMIRYYGTIRCLDQNMAQRRYWLGL